MRSKGRTLAAGFLVLTGTGFLVLSGAGIARAQPVAGIPAPAVCTELGALVKSFTATLEAHGAKYYAAHHSALVAAADNYGSQVLKITAHGSPALQSAAKTFVSYEETANAAGDVNAARYNADFDHLAVLACTPKGAPATGGGGSAGLQDPALFGAGGAIALAGVVVVGLALRNRSRTSAEHG
jgi:hypothetical protein